MQWNVIARIARWWSLRRHVEGPLCKHLLFARIRPRNITISGHRHAYFFLPLHLLSIFLFSLTPTQHHDCLHVFLVRVALCDVISRHTVIAAARSQLSKRSSCLIGGSSFGFGWLFGGFYFKRLACFGNPVVLLEDRETG